MPKPLRIDSTILDQETWLSLDSRRGRPAEGNGVKPDAPEQNRGNEQQAVGDGARIALQPCCGGLRDKHEEDVGDAETACLALTDQPAS